MVYHLVYHPRSTDFAYSRGGGDVSDVSDTESIKSLLLFLWWYFTKTASLVSLTSPPPIELGKLAIWRFQIDI